MNQFERFKEYFKKREQVVIGFKQGETHGYISKFDEKGIYLIQLNHSKEYFYSWNQCEIIAHAGYLVKKIQSAEVATLLVINIEKLKEKGWLRLAPRDPLLNSKLLLYNWKKEKFNINITDKECENLMEKYDPHLYKLYSSALYDLASMIYEIPNINKTKRYCPDLCFVMTDIISKHINKYIMWKKEVSYNPDSLLIKGKKYIGSINMYDIGISGGIGSYAGDIELKVLRTDTSRNNIRIVHPKPEKGMVFNDLPITGDNIEKVIYGKKELEQRKFVRPIATGDPYELTGIMVGFKIWQSKQGYMMANQHAELYVQ